MKKKIRKTDLFFSILLLPLLGLASILWVPAVTLCGKGATIAYVLKISRQQDIDQEKH